MYFLIILAIICCEWSSIEGNNTVQNSLAYLKVKKPDGSAESNYCYAIFIKTNLLLTAASCIEKSARTEIATLKRTIGRVAYALNHPDYRDHINYEFWGTDIAVLKLKKKANIKKHGIKLMELPTKPPNNYAKCIAYDKTTEEEFIVENEACKEVSRKINTASGMCLVHSKRMKRQVDLDPLEYDEDEDAEEDYEYMKEYSYVQDCGVLKGAPIMCGGVFTSIASDGNCTNSKGITFVPNLYKLLNWIDFADRELNDNAARRVYELFFQQYSMKNGTHEEFIKADGRRRFRGGAKDKTKHFNNKILIIHFLMFLMYNNSFDIFKIKLCKKVFIVEIQKAF